MPAVREPALLQSHWCRRCENQHCYSRTGAGGARTSTVTVALVRKRALLQSYWCENQHCYSRTGARTSTIAEQYWSLPWDRQTVTVTLKATLTRHGTSARPVQMVMQGKKPKSCGANRPSTTLRKRKLRWYGHITRSTRYAEMISV